MSEGQGDEFSPLQVVKKNLLDANKTNYRVYKTPEEFVTVESATALEALRESGIEKPFKILREIRFMERQLNQERFDKEEEVIETGAYEEDEAPPVKAEIAAPEDMALVEDTMEVERPSLDSAAPPAQPEAPAEEPAAEAPPAEAEEPAAAEAAEQEAEVVEEAEPVLEPEPTEELSPEDINALLGEEGDKPEEG